MEVFVAGQPIPDPLGIWTAYAKGQAKALARYDAPGPGNPSVLTGEEVWRSREIRARVTHEMRGLLPAVWSESGGSDLPVDANIQDADPLVRGGLYDQAMQVMAPFLEVPGVKWTIAYKILHIKRPSLFPIVDERLRLLYGPVEEEYRRSNADRLPDSDRTFWGVIRLDVLASKSGLDQWRGRLAQDAVCAPLAELSDLRLLDILAWRLAGTVDRTQS